MAENKRLGFAVPFVRRLHEGQNRKSYKFPYVVHLYEVMRLLQECKDYEDKLGLAKIDDDVLVAGLLHDVVEDCGQDIKDIRNIFGDKVADIVEAMTEDKDLPYMERKRGLIQKVSNSTRETKLVKCADNLSNLRDIVLNLDYKDDVWSLFNAPPQDVMQIQKEVVQSLGELEGNPIYEQLKFYCDKAEASAVQYISKQGQKKEISKGKGEK